MAKDIPQSQEMRSPPYLSRIYILSAISRLSSLPAQAQPTEG